MDNIQIRSLPFQILDTEVLCYLQYNKELCDWGLGNLVFILTEDTISLSINMPLIVYIINVFKYVGKILHKEISWKNPI